MKKLLLTAALAALAISPAISGDWSGGKSYAPSVAPPQVYNWTGFYIGVQAGGNFNPATGNGLAFDTNLDGNFSSAPGGPVGAAFGQNFAHEFDGSFSAGAHVGFDVQMSRLVAGIIADYNHTDIDENQTGFSATPAFYTERRSIDNMGTVRGRLGRLFGDRNQTLIYATGGLALGDVSYQYLTNTPATVTPRGGDDNVGYVFGAGLEQRLSDTISFSVEYLFTNFGDGNFTTNLAGGPFSAVAASTDSRGSNRDFDFHTIQAKISYRF